MKQRQSDRLQGALLPEEILPGLPEISWVPGRTVTAAGCKALLLVQEEEIRLSLGKWRLRVRGTGLGLTKREQDICCITGRVLSLSIASGDGEEP